MYFFPTQNVSVTWFWNRTNACKNCDYKSGSWEVWEDECSWIFLFFTVHRGNGKMATVSVLGLGHLSALQASGGESMRGARRQTSRLSASAVGIPGTPRLSTERKQGPQESKRDPPPQHTVQHSPPPFHRALDLHTTRYAGEPTGRAK